MEKIRIIVICYAIFCSLTTYSQQFSFQDSLIVIESSLIRTELYIDLIKQKKIGLVVNQSSVIYETHLVDSLINLNVNIKSIFSPEHGLKGNFEAGAKIENDSYKDIPVYSLYGDNKKPSNASLENIDLVLFDLQDVGVRFYTYISTLHYVMEACAENKVPLIILDRYNPHIYYIDGPVLKKDFSSFVGMHPVPVVYGMTIGEYALMINEEHWLKDSNMCDLTIIPLSNNQLFNNNKYFNSSHNFILKISPSPNLKTTNSIKLYPTLCFFEATPISIGRGTNYPFEVIGSPFFSDKDFKESNLFKMPSIDFIPKSREECISPKYKNKKCIGIRCHVQFSDNMIWKINLNILLDVFDVYSEDRHFFNSFFNKLAGNSDLKNKIIDGWSENEIRDSWIQDLQLFKKMREKYLIYPRSI